MSYLIDQFIHIFHYLFSLLLLLIVVPRFYFQKQYDEVVQQITTNFIKMVFILLVLGYLLVILRLFEILSVIFLLILTGSHLYRFSKKEEGMVYHISNTEAMIYDYFEGKYKLKQLFSFYVAQQYRQFKAFVKERFSTPMRAVETVSLLSILCIAIYIRFYDALVHPVPSFIDQYTNLKWVKDIRQNLLFNDGIVPQGFHVFWAVIQEFSRIDTLYMTKYTGPFIQMFIMFAIYVVVARLTGSRISGVVGLTVYALLGEYADPYFWEWQAVAAPGPFAHIFFLPTLYYLVLYLRDGHRDAFYTMLAGMGIIAFVQPTIFLEVFFFVCVVSLVAVVFKLKKELSSVPKVIFGGGMVGVISLVPVLVGLIYKRDTAFSFINYLQIDTGNSFCILPFPSFAPLLLSLMVGFLWFILFKWFRTYRYQPIVERCMLGGAIITALSLTPLQPVEPVKVDWDSSVAQYLAISKEISPLNWMIVSKQAFSSIVQGRGYHMNIEVLVNGYDPSHKSLTRYGFNQPDMNIPPHIFIFYEKSLRPIHKERVMQRLTSNYYNRWALQYQDLRLWIDQYMEVYPEVEIYYEDEHIIIYHLEREQNHKEIKEQIWGGDG